MPPALDLSLLPPALRDMAVAVADSVGASRELATVIGLGVGSACITGRVFVQLKPDWKEPGWAFLLVVAKPGEGKTPSFNHLVNPLLDWQTAQNGARRIQVEQSNAQRAMLEAEKAKAASKALFAGGGDTEHMPTTELTNDDFGGGAIDVLTLLVKCGLAASKGEARRLVQQGGVAVNDQKVSAIETTFGCEQFTGDGVIIKKGKKVFHKVVVED